MRVVAVIPALREAETIGAVVAAVAEHVDGVVVVDGHSGDGTAERATEAGADVVVEGRRGYGRACRTGIAQAAARGADIIAFVDGGDVGIHKHEQIARLLEEGRISTRALMIGDRDVDLFAAQRNGLDSAGVLWGYGTEEELRSGHPTFTLATPDDLNVLGGLTIR